MKNPSQVLRGHLVTEKTSGERVHNRYVFQVALDANKIDICRAIEKTFNVEVESVNTVNCKGKKRMWKGKPGNTGRYKKAYVTLASGQKIDKIDAAM
ncbi:MAG: 50S ribosomal protein L23 [Candidatus Margulisbacteria bacterium]|nr:50S ribosomal protein L23 [Candidatus Margulisiibacteriota bacterium]MBU1022105.1 50S ribosomal protein L23 [Candidatus Margulisiibacteriota bacterium]MBU1729700.1 50S ribosomal protein L23 [Candidatus Margulisiibacteriota bacterium]MBU1955020.1 50S ribosomal protein L23 [Candidatus Margulisiibacteriota bacterium]